MDVTISPEAVAKMGEAERAMYAARPAWFVVAYASAVWFGVAGSLALIWRKRWATPLFVLSLLGLIAQDIALFGRPEVRADAVVIVLQGLVFVIAVSRLWLSRTSEREGWTS
ncbi:MAG: hypothetical protein ACKO7G_02135 [Gammaproteobacteria bacterium]